MHNHLNMSQVGEMTKQKTGLRWLWITIAVLILDRITKYLVQQHFSLYETFPVMPHFNLTLAYNKGAAWSFLNTASGWQHFLFGGIALIVSIGILIWLSRLPSRARWTCIALTLIVGGALGNLSDRFLYGHVIDFIQLYAANWYWPTFNIADSAICVGAAMLFLEAVLSGKKT